MKRLILALALTGCATLGGQRPLITVPGDIEAARAVWELYGATGPLPKIDWVTGERLTCNDGRGFKAASFSGGCVAGLTDTPTVIHVAWTPGLKLHETSLAHELLHARWLIDLASDPLHKIPCLWARYENVPGMLERANAILASRGM